MWVASQGHPFMIVETMAALDDAARDVGPGGLPLPVRVRDVVLARLARLSEPARALAAVAAIIGRECDFRVLVQAAEVPERQAAAAVEELVRRRILRVREERFEFAHDRIREVVVSELLPARRRFLHRHVAAALEAGSAGEDAAALGMHFREAELWEEAARHFHDAGRIALARSGELEAVACFDEARAALGRLPPSQATLEQVVDVNLELRSSLMALANFARVPECLGAAEAAASALGDPRRQAWVELFLGQVRWWLGLSPDARAFAEYAESLIGAFDDRSLDITASIVSGFTWQNAGDYRRSVRLLRHALDLLEGAPVHRRHGHHSLPIPIAHSVLTSSLAELGDFAEARRHGRAALRLAEEAGHRHSLLSALWSLGHLARMTGDHDEAIRVLERAVDVDRRGEWWRGVSIDLGSAYVAAGRVDEGIGLLEEQQAALDRLGAHLMKGQMRESVGAAYLLAGRLDDARVSADDALALAREGHGRGVEAWAHRLHGEIASRREPLVVAAAAEHYRTALTIATELGMRPLMLHCHRGLARLYRRLDEVAADDHLLRATDLSRELDIQLGSA
jgi:tetratricopeptide (TPR) repeat protein